MIPRFAGLVVNGLLLGSAAVTLFPLLWMVSVSLMSPGEASTFPPPLLPRHATLGNYRELFSQSGIARYLVNSVLLTTAELRVLTFLPTHFSFREIAGRLYVSANTVKTQAHAVYRKLNAASRSEAVARAGELGLLDL